MLTLRTFLAGLRDPLGTIIRGMRPKDLNEAKQFIMQEENVHHFRNEKFHAHPSFNKPITKNLKTHNFRNDFSRQNFYQPPNRQTSFRNMSMNNTHPRNSFERPFNQNSFNFPSQPIDIRPRPVKHNFPLAQQVFGKPSTSKDTNVFKPNKNYIPTYKPTPMSISTHQGSNQKPRFTSQELFTTEDFEQNNDNITELESSENFPNVSEYHEIT